MNYIKRELADCIVEQTPYKAVVIYGPRRVGKTTLLRNLVGGSTVAWYDGDNIDDIQKLSFRSSEDVKTALMQAEIIAIDEAQRLPDIGLTLKRLVDANEVISKPVKIFATGSSSLSLAEGIKETAVGRLLQRQMWPLSISEIALYRGWGEFRNSLSQLLVYGTFPFCVHVS